LERYFRGLQTFREVRQIKEIDRRSINPNRYLSLPERRFWLSDMLFTIIYNGYIFIYNPNLSSRKISK
jgi:hypothetical protein